MNYIKSSHFHIFFPKKSICKNTGIFKTFLFQNWKKLFLCKIDELEVIMIYSSSCPNVTLATFLICIKVTRGYSVTRSYSVNANYLVVKIKLKLCFGHIMKDLDEIFLIILKMFIIELIFILLYCINRIIPGHRITPGHLKVKKLCLNTNLNYV